MLIAVVDAVLGVALGLLASAFARTEFQAVQFMPVVVLPQFFLCGLLVPVDQMAGWLQVDQPPPAADLRGRGPAGGGQLAPRPPARCGSTSASWPGAPCSPWPSPPPRCAGGPAERRPARRPAADGVPATPTPGTSSSPPPARRSPSAGFDGATIRGIAAAAGVDPALVHHYFGSKDKLFLAAIEAPADPAELLPEVLAAGRGRARRRGRPHAAAGLGRADASGRAAPCVRSAVGNEWTAKLLREFLVTQVLRRVVGTLELPPAEREARGALVASQLIGLVMARYVLKVEPLASASPESLVAAIGPTVQRYLTGDVELPG